jgi:hypothetical protein
MFLAHGEVLHRPGPEALVIDVFAEPFERLLRDGAADGTLRDLPPTTTATVLFNVVGWGTSTFGQRTSGIRRRRVMPLSIWCSAE